MTNITPIKPGTIDPVTLKTRGDAHGFTIIKVVGNWESMTHLNYLEACVVLKDLTAWLNSDSTG